MGYMQRRKRRELLGGAIREIVFGLEDSLVSTVGTVTGVAVGSGDRFVVILSGLVLVVVEAISMAAGSYLSSKSAHEVSAERGRQDNARILQERINDDESIHEFFKRKGLSKAEIKAALEALSRERKLWLREVTRLEHRFVSGGISPFAAASIMGVAYVLGGLLVFSPYFFLPLAWASVTSVAMAIVALMTLGIWKGRVAGVSQLRSGAEMVAVSVIAGALGVAVGWLVNRVFTLPL